MKKKTPKIILKKSKSIITSKEATDILEWYGLATSQQSVARYIREGKLKGEPILVEKNGEKIMDRRLGYQIQEKDLYEFIVERIPAVELLWKEIHAKTKAIPKAKKES